MGDVIADAMYEATKAQDFGGAVVAFMNVGGVRASLLYNQISGGEQPGEVTYGEVFTVQPFSNTLVVKTCTGQQLYDVLEQQFDNPAAGPNRVMRRRTASATRTPRATRPEHVSTPASLEIGGVTVDKAASYRVTMNNFLADGGDGFSVFTQLHEPARRRGRHRRVRAVPRRQHSPIEPAAAEPDHPAPVLETAVGGGFGRPHTLPLASVGRCRARAPGTASAPRCRSRSHRSSSAPRSGCSRSTRAGRARRGRRCRRRRSPARRSSRPASILDDGGGAAARDRGGAAAERALRAAQPGRGVDLPRLAPAAVARVAADRRRVVGARRPAAAASSTAS